MPTTHAPETCAAIYVRRSSAAGKGTDREGRSLAEQEAEARKLAERHGLEVVEVFAEREGVGASARSRKARPVWERTLDELEKGDRFRTVITYALDRADRRGAAHVGALLDRFGAERRLLTCDGVDTADSNQRMAIIVRAEVAREEAERIGDRVARAKKYARDAGRWLGGRPPFGLQVVGGRLAHDPVTFPIARRIAEEALAGDSLWSITRRLNADGVTSPRGSKWSVGSVASLLRTPGFAGLQSTRRRTASGGWAAVADVYRDAEGRTVSVGEGVITPDERARILRLLESRSESTGGRTVTGAPARTGVRRRPVSTLLAGDLLRCAHCGGPSTVSGRGDGRKSYRCAAMANRAGTCPGFSAPVEHTGNPWPDEAGGDDTPYRPGVDDYVVDAFLRRLASLRPGSPGLELIARRWNLWHHPDAMEAHEAARARLEDAEASLRRTIELAARGVLEPEEAEALLPGLREEVARAKAAVEETEPSAVLETFPLLDSETSWRVFERLPLAEKRATLELGIREVRVSRAGRRGVRFNPEERVEIIWSDDPA